MKYHVRQVHVVDIRFELEAHSPRSAFVYIWQYQVKESSVAEFEEAYGEDGDWVRLFRRFPGYLRTELMRDSVDTRRFVTIDYWRSERDYLAFRDAAATEFDRIDVDCSRLTSDEVHLGNFETVDRGD